MWLAINVNDVSAYLAAPQLHLLRTALLGAGESDPLPAIIADTVSRIRAELRANPRLRLSADATLLPEALRGAALALVVEAASARVPTLELSADQVRRAQEARDLVARVGKGAAAVEPPEIPEPVPSGPSGTLQRVKSRTGALNSDALRQL